MHPFFLFYEHDLVHVFARNHDYVCSLCSQVVHACVPIYGCDHAHCAQPLVTNVPFFLHIQCLKVLFVCVFFLIVGAKDPFHLSYSCSSLLLIKFMALLTMFLLLCFLTDILNGQILLHIMVMFLLIHHFVYGLLMFVILLFVFLFMILLFHMTFFFTFMFIHFIIRRM